MQCNIIYLCFSIHVYYFKSQYLVTRRKGKKKKKIRGWNPFFIPCIWRVFMIISKIYDLLQWVFWLWKSFSIIIKQSHSLWLWEAVSEGYPYQCWVAPVPVAVRIILCHCVCGAFALWGVNFFGVLATFVLGEFHVGCGWDL